MRNTWKTLQVSCTFVSTTAFDLIANSTTRLAKQRVLASARATAAT